MCVHKPQIMYIFVIILVLTITNTKFMTTKSTSLSFSELKTKATVLSSNMKLNVEKISHYGIELPAFTNEMDAELLQADVLNNEQERLKSELKAKTEELNALMLKLEKNYALGKKVVKLAEPQANWVAYGITDKK